jgi:hypothetical protein
MRFRRLSVEIEAEFTRGEMTAFFIATSTCGTSDDVTMIR